MYRSAVIIALTIFTQLTGSASFFLFITRDLNDSKVLEENNWIQVEVTTSTSVTVEFRIPVALSYLDAFVFFANDDKKILQVTVNETVQGKLYEAPYKLEKKMKGEETIKLEDGKFHQVSGSFPQTWLPEKYNKISAAVVSSDGRYYNYYKIQNFKISIPDLFVVEEYKEITSSAEINRINKESGNSKVI